MRLLRYIHDIALDAIVNSASLEFSERLGPFDATSQEILQDRLDSLDNQPGIRHELGGFVVLDARFEIPRVPSLAVGVRQSTQTGIERNRRSVTAPSVRSP